MNVQMAVKDGEVFILEVNPRASRTVPFVAKAIGSPLAKIAARVMAGERLADFAIRPQPEGLVAVKEAVFPFARFPGVDLLLGPEMKSTGEVMGLDRDFAAAFVKSQLGAAPSCPPRARCSSRSATGTRVRRSSWPGACASWASMWPPPGARQRRCRRPASPSPRSRRFTRADRT